MIHNAYITPIIVPNYTNTQVNCKKHHLFLYPDTCFFFKKNPWEQRGQNRWCRPLRHVLCANHRLHLVDLKAKGFEDANSLGIYLGKL